WAEAAFREARNTSIRLPSRLWDEATHVQKARDIDDPWAETIETLLYQPDSTKVPFGWRASVTTEEIFQTLGLRDDLRNKKCNKRIASVMQQFSYEHHKHVGSERKAGWLLQKDEVVKGNGGNGHHIAPFGRRKGDEDRRVFYGWAYGHQGHQIFFRAGSGTMRRCSAAMRCRSASVLQGPASHPITAPSPVAVKSRRRSAAAPLG